VSIWNDYRKVGRVCSDLEDRFGLAKVHGRMTGRALPEPSRADTEISAARGDPEPLRVRLERKVRACAAVATSEEHFTQMAKQHGLLIRPRFWFGGGKLAPDLTVTKLRDRWRPGAVNPVTRAADAVAAAASVTGLVPGGLSRAAQHMARAAQEPGTAAIVTDMADTFIAASMAGTAPALQLLTHLHQGAVIGARLARAIIGPANGSALAEQAAALRAAGYTETTPYDDHLRRLFGEQRWAAYAADPARIVAAAAITDAANAGHDVPALLAKVVHQRAWEDDQISRARSLAGVLAYRIETERSRRAEPPVRGRQEPSLTVTKGSHPSRPSAPARPAAPAARTPFDDRLRTLAGLFAWPRPRPWTPDRMARTSPPCSRSGGPWRPSPGAAPRSRARDSW